MVKKYELPDETMQLIAAGPDLINDRRYLQQRDNLNSRQPGSELIKALRASGTSNPGLTLYDNYKRPDETSARTLRRNMFNPGRLTMSRTNRDVILPGAEITPSRPPRVVDPVVLGPLLPDDEIIDEEVIDDDIIDDDIIVDDIIDDDIIDDTVVVDTIVGGTGNDTIVGGTGNDTVTGGSGGGTGGGTGGGDGGSGTGGTGTGGGTGTTGTGTVGTATTGTTGTGSTGTGDSLRDAITAAMGGSGASIDNSSAGLDMSSTSTPGSNLTASQIESLTRPKVPSVTLESSGPALDQDTGATSMTFDYPELLSADELKAYEAWLATQGGGAAGAAGKPGLEETLGALEF